MITRRSFLQTILPESAGMIVAPTLAETLSVNAKRYFFLTFNPLSEATLAAIELEAFINQMPNVMFAGEGYRDPRLPAIRGGGWKSPEFRLPIRITSNA
jgi:hypothetical protein